MTEKIKESKYLICAKCGKKILGGEGWGHVAVTDEDFHFDCLYGKGKLGAESNL